MRGWNAITVAVAEAILIGSAPASASAPAPPPASIRMGHPTLDLPAVGILATNDAICTATLIGCRSVLTAGHCVCQLEGGSCQPQHVPPEQVHLFFQHGGVAEVSAIDAGFGFADIALITLAQPVTGIVPAELAALSRPAPGAAGTLIGFGTDGYIDGRPEGMGIKRSASVELTSCGSPGEDLLYLCTKAEVISDPGTCPGDSGGPLIVDAGAGPVVAGVTLFLSGGAQAAECLPPFTEFYTDVVTWRTAIETAASGDVGSTTCGDLPAVGTLQVTVYPFAGELTSSVDEIGGEFIVPEGVDVLRVTMNGVLITAGQQNNFDLVVEREGECSPACTDTRTSAIGVCEIPSPAAGRWRVRAQRLQGEGAVQITATLFESADGTASTLAAKPELTVLHQLLPGTGCVGDCDGCGTVSIDELMRLVNIALGQLPDTACGHRGTEGPVTIGVLVQAVNSALSGCPVT